MLKNIKNDFFHSLNILESIGKIKVYSNGVKNAEDFFYLNEQLNFNATLNLLANLGESTAKVSSTLKRKYSKIEWQRIKDFRNKIVHDYAGINIFIVYKIIRNDLQVFESELEKLILQEIQNENFDSSELEVAKGSYFYRHVNFNKLVQI